MSRLLVIDLHHLGDAALALPFLRTAEAAGHEVWALGRPSATPIFGWVLPKERVLSWSPPWHEDSKKKGLLHGVTACRRFARDTLADLRFDCAVCVWADPRVHWLMRMAGIPKRVGYRASRVNYYAADFSPRRRMLWAGIVIQRILNTGGRQPLLTIPLDKASPHQHHLDSWRQIARELGLAPLEIPLPMPRLLSSRPDTPQRHEKKLAVAPAARLPSKTWSARHFVEVAAKFLKESPGWRITWILPPGWDFQPPDGSGTIERPHSLDALLAAVAQADLLLCNDSLPAHLATLTGTSVVSVFCTGNPAWFAPVGPQATASWRPLPFTEAPVADADGTPSYVHLEGPLLQQVLAALLSHRQTDKNS